MPLTSYRDLIKFNGEVLEVDLPKNKNGEVQWNSIGLGTGLIHAISNFVTEIQIEEIKQSPFWSIQFDESTNIKNVDVLSIYLRF